MNIFVGDTKIMKYINVDCSRVLQKDLDYTVQMEFLRNRLIQIFI